MQLSTTVFVLFFQLSGRSYGRSPEHAGWHPHGPGPLRGPGPQEVAVRRLVQRRHLGQQDGGRRRTWVRKFCEVTGSKPF